MATWRSDHSGSRRRSYGVKSHIHTLYTLTYTRHTLTHSHSHTHTSTHAHSHTFTLTLTYRADSRLEGSFLF